MPDIAEAAAVVGGLVVLNGRHQGTHIPLRLPATLIGSGPGCDVRLTADDVAEVHCLLVATPVGPAVRSLFPDSTHLNGRPTAAALLHDGDDLAVGPCTFRFTWRGGTAIVTPAEREEPPAAEWGLREREQALHEQEHQLATILEERQAQILGLLDQLSEGREKLRQERAAVAAERAAAATDADAARRLHARRKKDHDRTRRAAARLLRGARKECTTERVAAADERRLLAAAQDQFAAEVKRSRTETDAHTARLRDGWKLLSEAQNRLAADRAGQEAELSQLFQLLETRSAAIGNERAELRAAEKAFADERRSADARGRALESEIAGLEQRAAHLRAAVDDLELKRAEPEVFVPEALPVLGPVPLDSRADRSAAELLAELQYREHELDRERKNLAAARAELDRRADALADREVILAEQSARLDAARQDWQQSEAGTVGELEDVARELAARDEYLSAREAALSRVDLASRDRERDLTGLREKLDAWQAELTAHEARFVADKGRSDAELAARWGRVADREAALTEVCRVWGELRKGERDELRGELARWAEDRERFTAALAGLDRQREELLADAARVAGLGMALEEAKQAWDKATASPRAWRLLRVLRKRWEGRFRRYAMDLTRRREEVTADAAAVGKRCKELHRLLAHLAERHAELAEKRQTADREGLASARPAAADEPVILSLADARRERDAASLAAAREAAERLSTDLGLLDADERDAVPYPSRVAA
jgi:hypothetical protein